MRDSFREHHRITEEEQAELRRECTYVLDANVLLNIYRYADTTRDDLFRVLSSLEDRLWVPFQAASEFYRGRVEVIREQADKYGQLKAAIEQSLTALQGAAFRKSTFLQLEQIEMLLRPAIDSAHAVVEAKRSAHPDLIMNDSYLEQLATLVGPKLGSEPEKTILEKRCADAQLRIDREQPPGFRDAKKPTPQRFGDVLIWFELLDLAESTKRPIVFITDDDKEDWWQIVAGRKLGPRPELRQEMRQRAGVEFHIYNPAFFLEIASRDLSIDVSDSSVADAEKVAEESNLRFLDTPPPHIEKFLRAVRRERSAERAATNSDDFERMAEQAVYRELVERHTSDPILVQSQRPFSFIVETDSGRLAVEIQTYQQVLKSRVRRRVRDAFMRAYYELGIGSADDYQLFLVAPDKATAEVIASVALAGFLDAPTYRISVGFVGIKGEFFAIGNERLHTNG